MSYAPNRQAEFLAGKVHEYLYSRFTPPSFDPFFMVTGLYVNQCVNGSEVKRKLEMSYRYLKEENKKLSARVFFDTERDIFICEYNRDDGEIRQRFAMAWMLGHIMMGNLNEAGSERTAIRFDPDTDNYEDRGAIDFALAVLMPRYWCAEWYEVAQSIEQLSAAFGVSTAAMIRRLKRLRIL